MSVFNRSQTIQFTGTDYLRKVASAIAARVKVKIAYLGLGSDQVTHADMSTDTVYIKEADAWLYGDDYVVGNLLHEIGHLQFTPRDSGTWANDVSRAAASSVPPKPMVKPEELHSLYNMLEDRRMEKCVIKSVAGAPYYLSELNSKALSQLADTLEFPVSYTADTDKGVIDEIALDMATRQLKRDGDTETLATKYVATHRQHCENIAKQHIYWRILAHACIVHAGIPTTATLAAKEWREASALIVKMNDRAEKATADGVKQLAIDAYEVMRPWIDRSKSSSMPQSLAAMLKFMQAFGGHSPSDEVQQGYNRETGRYTMADALAQGKVAALKKLLLARMRENEHAKYTGGKKKGLLDKRALARTARDNFRVYRKRDEVKGRKYAASVVLDCSGSMWNRLEVQGKGGNWRKVADNAIDHAMQATALIARTLRAISVPTGISIFGSDAKMVLAHSDRYLVDELSKSMGESSYEFYRSGDNLTHKALTEALPRLAKASSGRHRLLFFITDGGLNSDDIEKSSEMLRAEMRRGSFTPMIIYIGQNRKILNDPRYERELLDINELVPTIVSALKALDV